MAGEPTTAWHRGFLAGIFDAEGSRSQGILRIVNTDEEILAQRRRRSPTFGFDFVREDRDRERRHPPVRGGLPEHLRFVHLVDPAMRRKCPVEGIAVKSDAGCA